MRHYFYLTLALLMLGIYSAKSEAKEPPKTIAVADFTGADKEYGRFIADTLLTDLTRSSRLNLVERNEIRHTLEELKLQSTGLTEPKQIQKIGKILSADGLIVGSYLQRGNILTINARLLEVRTGKLAAGGSANVSGSSERLLELTEKLARYLHQNLTGSPLPSEAESSATAPSEPAIGTRPVDTKPPSNETFLSLKRNRIASASAFLNGLLVERDLERLYRWAGTQFPRQENSPLMLTNPDKPVNRIRVLSALVKRGLPADSIQRQDRVSDSELTPDASRIPQWGRAYVGAAIEEQWWSRNSPLEPLQGATWAFVCKLLDRMPVDSPREQNEASKQYSQTPKSENRVVKIPTDAYTGLVLDAEGLNVERAMGPRILDEDGKVVYPLKGDYDYDALLEHGLVSYCEAMSQTAKRAGDRPLHVRVLDLASNSNSDFVVTRDDGERIRRANQRGKFLERWAVSVVAHAR